ncbi:ribosomal protein L7/L12 [Planomonospora sp. ID67723]|uniref:ribosomal protein L7/L12 n=1 Tax=Planomonospora sp. ID67723 TaxID=2738134 RepID=UPI0018C3932D|nr:ribosomal protein L7/L12 [Planomonospora sp. ID67723]MBG0831895.1 ribosomal protein L7/L12 [Planomonospora sp. ID67723]
MPNIGPTELLIFVVPILLIIGVALLVRRAGRSRALARSGVLAPRPMSAADLQSQAHALIAQGKQISAIKLVREQTGLGLAEAKRYVDDLAAGRMPMASRTTPHGDLAGRVRELKASGRAEQAVLLVRGETGMAEAEARSFVQAIN